MAATRPDQGDPERCISTHWTLPVQCEKGSSHRENWHEGRDPETGAWIRYRWPGRLTEELRDGEWLTLPAPPAAPITPDNEQQLRQKVANGVSGFTNGTVASLLAELDRVRQQPTGTQERPGQSLAAAPPAAPIAVRLSIAAGPGFSPGAKILPPLDPDDLEAAATHLEAWLEFADVNHPGKDHLYDVSYERCPIGDADLRMLLQDYRYHRPTQWAYDRACEALEKHRNRANLAEAQLAEPESAQRRRVPEAFAALLNRARSENVAFVPYVDLEGSTFSFEGADEAIVELDKETWRWNVDRGPTLASRAAAHRGPRPQGEVITIMSKPALTNPFAIQRIPIDQSDGDYRELLRIARFAADHWMLGPHGPCGNPKMTGADRTRGAVNEALLHLLELGLIDIDSERLAQLLDSGVPMMRAVGDGTGGV